MHVLRSAAASIAIASFLAPVSLSATGIFPDVPDQHPFKQAIE